MMRPGPSGMNDHLTVRRENGELLLVDGPRGCWLHEQTHPENEYHQVTASLVKRTLRVLVQQ